MLLQATLRPVEANRVGRQSSAARKGPPGLAEMAALKGALCYGPLGKTRKIAALKSVGTAAIS